MPIVTVVNHTCSLQVNHKLATSYVLWRMQGFVMATCTWRQTDVLIWLGFKTKNPQIKLLNNRSLSSLSSGGCKSKFKVQKDCSLLRLLFLSCKHPSSPWVCAFCVCVLTALKNIIIITINVFVCVYDGGVHMVQRACGGQKSPLWGHFPLPFTHWTISPLFFSRVLVVLN